MGVATLERRAESPVAGAAGGAEDFNEWLGRLPVATYDGKQRTAPQAFPRVRVASITNNKNRARAKEHVLVELFYRDGPRLVLVWTHPDHINGGRGRFRQYAESDSRIANAGI